MIHHIGKQEGPLRRAPRCIVAQGSEMHVKVEIGWLVMQINPQLSLCKAKALFYGLLEEIDSKLMIMLKMDNYLATASLNDRVAGPNCGC